MGEPFSTGSARCPNNASMEEDISARQGRICCHGCLLCVCWTSCWEEGRAAGSHPRRYFSASIVSRMEKRRRSVNMGRLMSFVPPRPDTRLSRYRSGKGNTCGCHHPATPHNSIV